ncbi:hypothetical protein CC86DRAFT_401838 [Ophiobolus disseminans]|uniref:F-box domain-containing protein n=1 Tax=Ophiobolus disseminans TaxID=1469910 RepID=A0A6A7AF60_9PLEO|nr:hypothetical protein CC86DRAFT_401838 [Ophiobolus disseminans]
MALRQVKGFPNLIPNEQSLAIAHRSQQHSPLLRLPAELRNRIYTIAIELDISLYFHTEVLDWDRLHLYRTCRQIYAETAPQYFTSKLLPITSNFRVRAFRCVAAIQEFVGHLTLADELYQRSRNNVVGPLQGDPKQVLRSCRLQIFGDGGGH